MKILLDACMGKTARRVLEAEGYDVVGVLDLGPDPGDEVILQTAYNEERILITLDRDFGELAVLHQQLHHGIIRLSQIPAKQQGQYCLHVLISYGDDLQKGAIATVTPNKTRLRLTSSQGQK
ncbi:MAG: DUF5615 family PIN-like protein [Chloroflexia bacterium]